MEGKGGGGGGGEVRRLHIIYFLSHMGRVEHPHLIRVHHFTRTGIYLRDVKRWLGDLRGKDMPEAYAWSYKRRYKTGYVWQDLVDDDLITPLSDNEYVLKGSQIISTPNDEKRDSHSYSCEKKKGANSTHKELPSKVKTDQIAEDEVQQETTTPFSFKESQKKIFPDSKIDPPSKIFSEINEESSSFGSGRSSLTDDFDSVKFEATKNLAPTTLDDNTNNKNYNISTPLYSKKSKNKNTKITSDHVEEMGSSSRVSSSSRKSPMPAKRKSFSGVGGASNVLRNIITCGAVDTNDKVLVMLNRNGAQNSSGGKNKVARDEVFRTSWDDHKEEKQQQRRHSTSRRSYDERKGQKNQQTDFTKQKPTPPAYRPVWEPNCSQCGKTFKPEKMHSHMKSCSGMKSSGKSNWSNLNAPTSMEKNTVSHSQGSYKESSLGYFLTN